jgi:tRNA threonylcarbamoyl adenosine modification protein YeaZ
VSTGHDARHDGRRPAILAMDTSTTRVVIATGSPSGVTDGISTWPAGYRHGETLLPSIGRFLGEQNIRRSRLTGIVVGTGPGAFTGLRVGIATAKGIAHGLGIPLVGVSTGEALLAASGVAHPVLLLPAGPSDRLVVRPGARPLPLPASDEPEVEAGETLLALDLDGRAPPDAIERGEAARQRLGHELVRLGADRLRAAGSPEGPSELETLVPDYVTLPRGVRTADGTVEWSRDHR